ncbi:MAG: hypothetical protein Q4G18_13200 [Myroides sp.]|nr:hypothetical protein [Myroides sp.]
MKKSHLKVLVAATFLATTGLSMQSCNNDDNGGGTSTGTGIATTPTDFKGEVKSGETVTLDANVKYVLTGAVHVREGGKLVIPAGTVIEADANDKNATFITVHQGGLLEANGTATSPVIFTSSIKEAGSWGGIIMLGRAPINRAIPSQAEVGDGVYGGTIANDNSGILNYVRIEYAGNTITKTIEFNGLSLFGVGNGTTISNVSILNGSDDGIEFFGGTVNVSNLVLVGNDDDNFDWTEGWSGTATNIYASRGTNTDANRGIEADNLEENYNATPISNPNIKNATFIGTTEGTESQAIKLRRGTHGTLDNIVLSGFSKGIDIEHDETLTWFNGTGKITNVRFVNIATEASGKATSGSAVTLLTDTYTVNSSATGAGNGVDVPTWAGTWAGL